VSPEATRPEPPPDGRVALVTGAGRGIGRATALALGRRGMRCILLGRTPGALEETDDLLRSAGAPDGVLLPLDLADGPALDRLGPSIAERFGRLDILVHAAAELGALTPMSHGTEADWQAAFSVGLGASWRLIRTCAPLLEAAPQGRAIFLTDPVARAPRAFWGMLAASKADMEALVGCWAEEMRTHPRLRIHLHAPAPSATRLRARAMPGESPATLSDPMEAGEAIAELCGQ